MREFSFFRYTMSNNVFDLLILRAFRLVGRPSKVPSIRLVFWHPPLQGWIKVNTYGASCSVPGDGGCEGVFRTYRPFVKGCFAFPLKNVFAFKAELFIRCLFFIDHMEFQMPHIFWEGNKVADALASHMISFDSGNWWFLAHIFCNAFLVDDVLGRHSYCFK
ncbi:hypothetical protein UlMin_045417 [Ulmus minor]